MKKIIASQICLHIKKIKWPNYDENLIKLIDQFPTRKFLKDFNYDKTIVGDTTKFWIKAQEKINQDKKLKFFKTHNAFGKVNNYDFTNSSNSLGGIYIVRDPRNVITSIKSKMPAW